MNGKYSSYRIYLPETLRKNSGIKYYDNTLYMYLDSEHHLIVSKNRVPRNLKYSIIKAKICRNSWGLEIPYKFLPDHKPYDRYALKAITEDKKTYQVVKISSRIFLKERENARITPLSKSGRAKINKLKLCSNTKSTAYGKDAYLIDTLS